MGDRRDWLPEFNGPLIEESPIASSLGVSLSSLSLSSPVTSNPRPDSVSADRWCTVERVTKGIISHVQPTVISDERRRAVIDYVQQLIRGYVGCEVFPFGSVPLKTYLPDGDIDITAFGGSNHEDALSNEVFSVLEGEEQNQDADFIVKDVQVVNAEVKLVKCLVQNIVVDISFNQLGGLCTLCFLEQVDRLIGKDHLFKRSVILIKTWCYYESRILGAHHGLISTYALETLVLYIFHLFHSRLDGPLSVLYRFLDYFSKFDWENYCISINGPIPISSLPDITAEKPDNGGLDLLLSTDFLSDCVDMFSVPDPISRPFVQKHLNIVDPLKDNNNLGRSVSKGNFFRIRSAFTYGARKLGRTLDRADDSLSGFFANTLERHGDGCRPDVDDPPTCSAASPQSYFRRPDPSDLGADIDAHVQSLQYGRYCHFDSVPSWLLHPVPSPPFPRPLPPFFPVFPKPRGTGTYFPNLHQLDKRRYGAGGVVKGRGLVRSPRGSNGVAEVGMSGRAAVDWMHVQVHPPRLVRPNGALEFGPFARPRPPLPPPPSSLTNKSLPPPPASLGSPSKKSVPASNDDKGLTYQLKDDEDFPPLTG